MNAVSYTLTSKLLLGFGAASCDAVVISIAGTGCCAFGGLAAVVSGAGDRFVLKNRSPTSTRATMTTAAKHQPYNELILVFLSGSWLFAGMSVCAAACSVSTVAAAAGSFCTV